MFIKNLISGLTVLMLLFRGPSGKPRKPQELEMSVAEPLGTVLLQFSSVAQLCPTLCDPMNCSMPGHIQGRMRANNIAEEIHPFKKY